ncbi:MAG: TetR/AcrR family transcriptional regulator [Blastomonas fulva]|uniref:TetR/AcrR family transcriptional regulator n=1 Tax=Blastomonas fulva TaxID=1550728 RepID=UPI0024E267B1|nr:TetR family transcriptional regulator [Blastomonas fulva]MDK2757761.1 TetR/AcrR family transcriptional regulator [Blastomonas fulva]
MSRPLNDHDAIRAQLMDAAEDMVRARGAINLSLSEVAAACGMSQSSFYRYFPSKEAFFEAIAGRWFEELNQIMEEVVASDLPPREKLFQFFARRVAVKRARFEADPALFKANMDLGEEHWEVIRGYVDLADHYMAMILGEAMAEGYFPGFDLDHVVSLTNLMVQPFCNPTVMMDMIRIATPDNLRIVIDTLFEGLAVHQAASSDATNVTALRAIS